jgi:hypothetical protein
LSRESLRRVGIVCFGIPGGSLVQIAGQQGHVPPIDGGLPGHASAQQNLLGFVGSPIEIGGALQVTATKGDFSTTAERLVGFRVAGDLLIVQGLVGQPAGCGECAKISEDIGDQALQARTVLLGPGLPLLSIRIERDAKLAGVIRTLPNADTESGNVPFGQSRQTLSADRRRPAGSVSRLIGFAMQAASGQLIGGLPPDGLTKSDR